MQRVPWIAAAVLIQIVIRRIHRLAGAILGFVLTTAILVWGLAQYAGNSQVAFFFIPLPEGVFVILCVAWYAFDGYEVHQAWKERQANQAVALQVEELKRRRDVDGLVDALWSLNDYRIARAKAALKELQSPRTTELLVTALGSEKDGVRGLAAEALGELGDSRAIEPLRALQQDPNVMVKAFAMLALNKIQPGAGRK